MINISLPNQVIEVINKSLLLLGLTLLVFSSGPVTAAAADFAVTFAATPLFLDADVKPGDETTRTVTITNLESDPEPVSVSVNNSFDTGLASVMNLSVTANSVEYFSGSFADFFADTPLPLGSLAGGETVEYDFTASLPSSTGNAYQETQLGFDLVIGWDGGSVDDGGTTPGGRGGGGGGSDLVIFNEEVDSVNAATGVAVITWNTNRDASSYLVCGDTSTGSFTLDPDATMFGYQFVVSEVLSDTSSHSLATDELDPGDYECRPASREDTDDDFTVGDAVTFTVPDSAVAGAATSAPRLIDWADIAELVSANFTEPTGSVLGAGTKGSFGAPTYDEWRAEMDAERDRQAAEAENNEASTSTTDTEAIPSTAENNNETNQAEDRGTFNWFWIILAVAIAGLILGWRKFRV